MTEPLFMAARLLHLMGLVLGAGGATFSAALLKGIRDRPESVRSLEQYGRLRKVGMLSLASWYAIIVLSVLM